MASKPQTDVAGAATPETEAKRRQRLGEILLASGKISEAQLEEALARKRESGRRIGEELVAAGHVSSDIVERALKVQRRWLLVASLAGLSPVNSVMVGAALAGEARGALQITATVVDSVSIRPLHQAESLTITAQDVARGYVEVPAASRFEIRNTKPCLFEFRTAARDIFKSVRVTGGNATAQFGAEGGTLLQGGFAGGASVQVGYRFELAAGVQPGTYGWPLSLTVMPL